ncbi:MFS transporter [Blautia liquoris]|uniref:MFS transporter n=1 Tax=Blautia liquoris TaxID=2779518 RepID=A0A7M2RD17_9FIRM|nr:MFS transporter [Blautia liquoris]QOV18176.1 MFS transporter [Blautia liquoris]
MNKISTRERIRNHPLIRTLFELEGNQKVLTFLEPLWGIPQNLIAPYATLYMYELGVNDVQIGLLMSIAMFVQMISAFAGGIIADRAGRKVTCNFGDFLGWCIPCVIWAVSQNFWFFLAAIVLNSFEQVNQTAWNCLLIEDAPSGQILHIYTWVTISGLLSVFFAPISGFVISRVSLVPVMRVLYFIFAVCMTVKCLITIRCTKETRQGMKRKEQTKGQSLWYMISEYRYILPRIFQDKPTVKILIIMVLLQMTTQITNNFFSLYTTENLGIQKSFLALFPILRAVIMLIFMFVMQEKLENFPFRIPMGVGFLLYIGSQLILIFSPHRNYIFIILYTIMEAFAFALVVPRKDSMLALYVDPEERARIVSVLGVIMFIFASPSGYIAGKLSSINRQLPFILNMSLYVISGIITIRFNDPLPEYLETEND